jgi:hypothetical protein
MFEIRSLMLALIVPLAMTASTASTQDLVRWRLQQSVDPVTDKKVASAFVTSDDVIGRLSVRCDSQIEQVVSIQYAQSAFIGSSTSTVIMRFDGGPPIAFPWQAQGKAVYISDEKAVRTIAGQLLRSKRVFVRAYDYNMQPKDKSFYIGVGADVIRQVFTDCDYSPLN